MTTFILKSDLLANLGAVIAMICPVVLIIGIIMAFASVKNRKLGIKLIIGSIICFIIGFGTCLVNLNLGAMH